MGCCCSTPIDFDEEVWLGHFFLGNAIGKGGFTRVKIVEHAKTKELYALKFMDKPAIVNRRSAKNYIRERKILEELDHIYITNLRWAFQDDKYLYFVLDLMIGGDLRYHHDRKWCPGEPAIKIWMAQVASAIAYLHSKKIIHRDLKIDNVLLDSKGHAHISDFNCATWIHSDRLHYEVCGTRRYMAPEMIKQEGYDWQIDYWALGVMTYEMIFTDMPFCHKVKGEEKIFQAIKEGELTFPPNAEEICSKDGQDYIRALLQKDPRRRLGCRGMKRGRHDIRTAAWNADINWEQVDNGSVQSGFVPDSEKLNFNISHELDEFLVVEKPLTQGRRRKKDRDLSKLDSQERDMEEQFLVFDYTKNSRQSHHPDGPTTTQPYPRPDPTGMLSLPTSLAPTRSPTPLPEARARLSTSSHPVGTGIQMMQLPASALHNHGERPVTISGPYPAYSSPQEERFIRTSRRSMEAGTGGITTESPRSSLTCVTPGDS